MSTITNIVGVNIIINFCIMAIPQKDAKIPENVAESLLLEKHSDFIANYEKNEYECVTTEFLGMSAIYWSLTAMDLMGEKDRLSKHKIITYLSKCCHESGGFSPTEKHDPHILYTLSAVQIAAIYDVMDEAINADAVVDYVKSLLNPDGSFSGDQWGEVDSRFSFCAVAILSLLGRLNDIDLSKSVEYICQCMNFDGGFGTRPGSESHAGNIYCCVGFLSITQNLDKIDEDALGFWLAERQLPSGGLNGRPQKLPDVCYSWWVLASLTIIGRLHWIDAHSLAKFIYASQDTETGGISDRPGDYSDPFHTLFGIAGLSLLKNCPELKTVNPVFCMPQYVLDKLRVVTQKLSS